MELNDVKNKRIYYLDLLRVLACLSVIVIHTCTSFIENDIGSFNFWCAIIPESLGRICVPIFVMISGALFLDKNYDFNKQKLIKHIKKLVLVFIFWAIVYWLIFEIGFRIIIKKETIDIVGLIGSLISGYYHLWFIYLIIGLYLITPLLRLWVKEENKKYIEYFLILALIFNFIIPQIISVGANFNNIFFYLRDILNEKLYLDYVCGYTAYYILGWYLNNYSLKRKNYLYVGGIIGLLVSIFGTYLLSIILKTPRQLYGYLSLNVLLQSTALFVFVKSKSIDKDKENIIIHNVAKHGLGIYVTHLLALKVMYKVFLKIGFESALAIIPLVTISTIIISFVISYIFSKIPVLKKVV